MDALRRIGAFLWSIVASLILQVAVILAIVFAFLDLVWLVLTGSSIGTDNWLGEWAMRFIKWPFNLMMYALFGKGSFQWTP